MPTWTTPKTDWQGTDYFEASDWLRIVGNVEYIADQLGLAYTPYTTVAAGTLLTSTQRNEVTDMLNTIYTALNASWNRGIVAPRVDYGSAWNSKDLNNIEEFLLNAKAQIDGEFSDAVIYYSGDEIYCGDIISVGLL